LAGGSGGNEACVIRLEEAVDQDGVAALCGGLAEFEFELADLAAAEAETRTIVPLHEDTRPVKRLG